MNDKWKSLVDLVVNEEEDKAKELFHEIAVEESRKIYENLIDEEDLADIEETEAVEEKTEEVDEASDEEKVDEANKSSESVEEASDEAVEENFASDDETADMIDDIKADEVGMEAEDEDKDPEDDAEDMAGDMDMGDDNDGEDKMSDDDAERMEDELIDLQSAIDDLRSEFETMTGKEADAPEGEMEMPAEETAELPVEGVEETSEETVEEKADEEVKEDEAEKVVEYKEKAPAPVTTSDASKSPVASSGKGGVKTGSADEKGRPAPKAQDMGSTTKPDMKPTPKADHGDHSDNKTSPVAKK